MKKIILLNLLIFVSVSIVSQNINEEKEAIKKVIQTAYVEGLQNEGDIKKIDSGIHPDFKLMGIAKNGKMWYLSISEWKKKVQKRLKEGELPRKKGELITVDFKHIDVTGNAAIAKFEFLVAGTPKYVDYISLYKFDDGWKMVNKIYYQLKK